MRAVETALRDQEGLAERVLGLADERRALRRAVIRWRLATGLLAAIAAVMVWRWPA